MCDDNLKLALAMKTSRQKSVGKHKPTFEEAAKRLMLKTDSLLVPTCFINFSILSFPLYFVQNKEVRTSLVRNQRLCGHGADHNICQATSEAF